MNTDPLHTAVCQAVALLNECVMTSPTIQRAREVLREALIAHADAPPLDYRYMLARVVFMARTSGGTAGPDKPLMDVLDIAERMLNADPSSTNSHRRRGKYDAERR